MGVVLCDVQLPGMDGLDLLGKLLRMSPETFVVMMTAGATVKNAVEAFGRQIVTLDLPALIQAKRATGRQKDLSALPELEGLLEAHEP